MYDSCLLIRSPVTTYLLAALTDDDVYNLALSILEIFLRSNNCCYNFSNSPKC